MLSPAVINTPTEALRLAEVLIAAPKPVTVTLKEGMPRTLSQNALIHKWFGEIARQRKESIDEVKCACKAWHGVPILLAEDEEFADFYLTAIKPLTVEQKLTAMRYLPVTSIMTKDQLSRFADAVFKDYTQQGVLLTVPEDRAA